jgi:alpha,alpha-trehalase
MQSRVTTSGESSNLPLAPSQLYGPLFAAVQESGLFADSKTFADAVPLRDPAVIAADYARSTPSGSDALRGFVMGNFALPVVAQETGVALAVSTSMDEHITALWPILERNGAEEQGSAIGLRHRFLVPGGRFRELYYWDSYFTMLGLATSGRQDLIEEMVDLFADLIDRFGHVPNGTRSYYLSRSQPPVFFLMAGLSRRRKDPRLLTAMRREHDFWMSGGRVVDLPGGAQLNRFWDDADYPRDESWAEDIATAGLSNRPSAELWRDLRAGAESGWDFSSRWLADGRSLETIRTTRIIPSCLNALLFGLESTLAAAGHADMAVAAERRRKAIATFNWNDAAGFFADYLIDEQVVSSQMTAAMTYPLFTACASPSQARRTVETVRNHLVAPGGLRTTLVESGQQWDRPNGWAPLQWIACQALENYGAHALAADIAQRWIRTAGSEFAASGRLLEKYDIESGGVGGGGEYEVQEGFGWTNGVTAALIARYSAAA